MSSHKKQKNNNTQKSTLAELLTGLRKDFGKKLCLHPNAGKSCSLGFIKAHTIQKKGGLSAIARDGHVYTSISPSDDANVVKTGYHSMKLIGVNDASTFTGFCGYHDTKTFAPIETKPWIGSSEQCFLVAYRALCRDLYMKHCNRNSLGRLYSMARKRNFFADKLPFNYRASLLTGMAMADAALKELRLYKNLYDVMLTNSDFSAIRFYQVNIDKTPDILCTGNFQPEYTFSGHFIQDMCDIDELSKHITYSILAHTNGGVIVFAWPDDNKPAVKLAQSFHNLHDAQVPHAALRLAYEHLENTYASPDWWENLDEATQGAIKLRQLSGTPVLRRPSSCLTDDGLRLVNWNVLSRSTNVTLD